MTNEYYTNRTESSLPRMMIINSIPINVGDQSALRYSKIPTPINEKIKASEKYPSV